ncbi:unnamed protein product [marine sediment metagenome]|uniref:Uncharacterized protein n=1 Tax=marine sediment metagenome TaxID=412755 RepID=X0RKD6_9ZZZZ
MPKKCIICREEANFKVKDTSNYYCKYCGKEYFNDLRLLQKLKKPKKQEIELKFI